MGCTAHLRNDLQQTNLLLAHYARGNCWPHDKYDPDWKLRKFEEEDKGYLTTDEASGFIGAEVSSADDLDDLVMTLDTEGIDLQRRRAAFTTQKKDRIRHWTIRKNWILRLLPASDG